LRGVVALYDKLVAALTTGRTSHKLGETKINSKATHVTTSVYEKKRSASQGRNLRNNQEKSLGKKKLTVLPLAQG